jgi:hypothetical protein
VELIASFTDDQKAVAWRSSATLFSTAAINPAFMVSCVEA